MQRDGGAGLFHERPELLHVEEVGGPDLLLPLGDRHEPLLKLKWNESGRRSVFLARFGDPSPVKNSFITAADLCGPADRLF